MCHTSFLLIVRLIERYSEFPLTVLFWPIVAGFTENDKGVTIFSYLCYCVKGTIRCHLFFEHECIMYIL
jgi:hypothetical protein